MIYYKTTDEIKLIRESSLLVSETLALMAGLIKPVSQHLSLMKKLKRLSGIMELVRHLKDIAGLHIHYVFR